MERMGAFLVKLEGVEDVAIVHPEPRAVAHDIASDERVFYDAVDLADGVRLAWFDVVIDTRFFLSFLILDAMGDIGMEIAHLVEVTLHLVGRAPGFSGIVIDGFLAEGGVHPSPKLAVGSPLRFVVKPCRPVGFKSAFVRLQRDVR